MQYKTQLNKIHMKMGAGQGHIFHWNEHYHIADVAIFPLKNVYCVHEKYVSPCIIYYTFILIDNNKSFKLFN